MFQTAGYPAHPPYFSYDYDYRTPPRTPPTAGGHNYYSPRHNGYTTSTPPQKGHTRRTTADPSSFAGYASYTTPRKSQYVPEYASPGYYASAKPTPQRRPEPDYVPIFTSAAGDPMDHRPRPRRSSYTEKPKPHVPPPRPRTSHAHRRAPPQATAEDALRAGIPAGFSYKNWDPTEEPILLLGSAFDANSLGKWIYDWSVFYYGAASPISEIAGELWLLLIQLAGKIKRAEECMPKIRQTASRDMVEDFLDAGERLWIRFSKLLKICENYMWKAARKECGSAKNITMGKTSGCEFVDAVFGRDRELERTEKLMTGMRLWSMRFDSNCEEILRNPAA